MFRMFIAALCLSASLAAQQPLSVTFSALDKHNQPVRALRAENIRIEHEGELVAVERLQFDEHRKLDVVVLFDVSNSQRAALEEIRDAASEVLRQLQLRRGDRLSIIVFTERMLEERTDIDLDEADKLLFAAWPRGLSAIFDAILRAPQHFSPDRSYRRVVLLLSDGDDSASQVRAPGDVIKQLAQHDAALYGVDLNPMITGMATRASHVLDQMAHASGGETCYPRSEHEISRCAAMVAASARSVYTATLSAPTRLEKTHKLKVKGPEGVRILAPTRHTD